MNNIGGLSSQFPEEVTPSKDGCDQSDKNKSAQEKKVDEFVKAKGKKAKEAEDVSPRQELKRSLSTPRIRAGQASGVKADQIEVSKRSGEMWECVKRTPDVEDGYLYTFRLKDEYDDVSSKKPVRLYAAEEKVKEIFPAIEPYSSSVQQYDPALTKEKFLQLKFANAVQEYEMTYPDQFEFQKDEIIMQIRLITLPIFKRQWNEIQTFKILGLGVEFCEDGVYFTLPDKNALLARWEKLREMRPELPKLHVHSSEGIADDMDFVEAYFTHDVLMSDGKEFIHDYFAHILPTIGLMVSSEVGGNPKYSKQRVKMIKQIGKIYRRIKIAERMIVEKDIIISKKLKNNLDKIKGLLGAYVDVFTNIKEATQVNKLLDGFSITDHLKLMVKDNIWKPYWNRRFGAENTLNEFVLEGLLSKLEILERRFDLLKTNAQKHKLLMDDFGVGT